jgi:hypothetical protein
MKRIVVGICLLLVILAAANLIPGRAQEATHPAANGMSAGSDAPPTHNWAAGNLLKIALLKWYQANTVPTSFVVGKMKNSNPYGLAFDGEHIWTANKGEGSVTKVRASDGANLGTFDVGGEANGVVFDGANIWVTVSPDTIIKLRASDGKMLGKFTVGGAPWWPAFDGENIWVPNFFSGTLSKLRASDGKTLGTFPMDSAIGTAFDGEAVWVTNYGPNTATKVRPSDGKVLGVFPVGNAPIGVVFDGANIWVANQAAQTVSKLRASDGKTLGTFNVPGLPYGVAFDGANIWVTGTYVVELRASDGAQVGWFWRGLSDTTGVAFDGANIWVAESLKNSVTKF